MAKRPGFVFGKEIQSSHVVVNQVEGFARLLTLDVIGLGCV